MPEYQVVIRHAPEQRLRPWNYVVVSETGANQAGSCSSRAEAYACAHSTLRGMIALERVRSLSR